MQAMSEKEAKSEARIVAYSKRQVAHDVASGTAPEALTSHAFPAKPVLGASTVSAFYPYQTEIDTRPLLGVLAADGWMTCLPVVVARHQPLEFRRWYPGEPTEPGKWNIPVPLPTSETAEPDVLLVPLLAFDRKGFRLGYGGGFYDMTLAKLRAAKKVIAIGVAYAGQEVASVPRDEMDQPLDYVMTEREVFRCG